MEASGAFSSTTRSDGTPSRLLFHWFDVVFCGLITNLFLYWGGRRRFVDLTASTICPSVLQPSKTHLNIDSSPHGDSCLCWQPHLVVNNIIIRLACLFSTIASTWQMQCFYNAQFSLYSLFCRLFCYSLYLPRDNHCRKRNAFCLPYGIRQVS